jgi:polar amino acid transport system substrate-binding protein
MSARFGWVAALFSFAAMLGAVGFARIVVPADDALARIRATGVIRIGYAVEAPYAFVAPDGRVTGVAPERVRLLAARLGARHTEWVQTGFDNLIADLLEGRFDLIASGMFITPARAGSVSFAEPNLRVTAGLLVRAGNPKALRSYREAIADPGVRLATLAGSVEAQRLRARGMPADRILVVPDARTGRAAIESGVADALALSLPTVREMARARPATLQAVGVLGRESPNDADSAFYVAFAFAPANGGLLRAWNEAQAALLSGTAHLEVILPFGFGPSNLPGSITLSELIK